MDNIKLKITNELKHFDSTPQISSRYSGEEKQRIAKAAKDFESLLTSMMVKSMTESTGGLFGSEGYGEDYFDTIFQNELSTQLSNQRPIGIADMIYRKMTGESLKDLAPVEVKQKFQAPKIKLENVSEVQPSVGSLDRLKKYESIIEQASESFGIEKNLIKSVILAESAGNPKAYSKAKAKGLMQLIDSTAADMGVRNVWDPKENITGGAKYLSQMFRQYNGKVELALAAYNAGPANVDKHNGIPPFEETKNYVSRVMSYMKYLENQDE
ncbi:MAG: hypothetical protein Fur0015_11910 [Ignavibacteriales bacterium]